MKRLLLAGGLLFLLIHWLQAFERCRLADRRCQAARAELQSFEESLKEWPQLRLQAGRLRPIENLDPNQFPHSPAVQIAFSAEKLEGQPIFRMRLRGPRPDVVQELRVLVEHFSLTTVELQSRPDGQIQGQAVLLGVP